MKSSISHPAYALAFDDVDRLCTGSGSTTPARAPHALVETAPNSRPRKYVRSVWSDPDRDDPPDQRIELGVSRGVTGRVRRPRRRSLAVL
jgi:hypothetical protein